MELSQLQRRRASEDGVGKEPEPTDDSLSVRVAAHPFAPPEDRYVPSAFVPPLREEVIINIEINFEIEEQKWDSKRNIC